MIQDTSLEQYLTNIYPNLAHRQAEVLHYMRNAGGAMTNREIAEATGKPINEITPRTNELVKLGLVLDRGRRPCRITKHGAHIWQAKYPVLPPAFKSVQTNTLL